jgi:hypothetical protein
MVQDSQLIDSESRIKQKEARGPCNVNPGLINHGWFDTEMVPSQLNSRLGFINPGLTLSWAGWGSQELDPLNHPVVNGGGRFGTLGYPVLEREASWSDDLGFPTPWGSEVDDS